MSPFDDTDAAIDALLTGGPAAAAPPGFADRVLARVAVTPQIRPAAVGLAPARDPLPWWVRIALQPASILSFVLAGLIVVLAAPLRDAAERAPEWGAVALAWSAAALAPWVEPLGGSLGRGPLVDGLVGLAVLPVVLVFAFGLYRLGVEVAAFGLARPLATLAHVRRP